MDRSIFRALAQALEISSRLLGPSLGLGFLGYWLWNPTAAAILAIVGFAIGVWVVISRQGT